MRRIAFLVLACLMLLPSAAWAVKGARNQLILPLQTVSTGTPKTVTITETGNATGYLVVQLTNQAAAATLNISVDAVNPLLNLPLCQPTQITGNGTVAYLLGMRSTVTAPGLNPGCTAPLTATTNFVFTVGAVGGSFSIEAYMLWVHH
jgi:hypothetical protein